MKKQLICLNLALIFLAALLSPGALAYSGMLTGTASYTAGPENSFTYTPAADGWYTFTVSAGTVSCGSLNLYQDGAGVGSFGYGNTGFTEYTILSRLAAGVSYTLKHTAGEVSGAKCTLTAAQFGDVPALTAGQGFTYTGEENTYALFAFTPAESGFYYFDLSDENASFFVTSGDYCGEDHSAGYGGYSSTYGLIGGANNQYLTAGRTYFADLYSSGSTENTVTVTKTKPMDMTLDTHLVRNGSMASASRLVSVFTPTASGTYTFTLDFAPDGSAAYDPQEYNLYGELSLMVTSEGGTILSADADGDASAAIGSAAYFHRSSTLTLAAGKSYYMVTDAAAFDLSGALSAAVEQGSGSDSLPFADVPRGAWYYGNVKYAYENKLFSGTSDDTFEPNTAMTRAMLVRVLWNLEGQPAAEASAFTDLTAEWYTGAVNWAAANKIVEGSEGRFNPNGKVTREQAAAILYRYAKYKGYGVSGGAAGLSGYPDASAVSSWAAEAMTWAVNVKLITGSDGKLLPQGSAVRAQVAAILERFISNVVG